MKFVVLLAIVLLVFNLAKTRSRLQRLDPAQNPNRVLRLTICVWAFWLLFLGVCLARPALLILAPVIVGGTGGLRLWRNRQLEARRREIPNLEKMKRAN